MLLRLSRMKYRGISDWGKEVGMGMGMGMGIGMGVGTVGFYQIKIDKDIR